MNDTHIRLAKLKGEFVWHHHAEENELFLVLHGALRIEFRNKTVTLKPGELIIVPRGVEHRPVAENEVHVLLVEPRSMVNTGNVRNNKTVNGPKAL